MLHCLTRIKSSVPLVQDKPLGVLYDSGMWDLRRRTEVIRASYQFQLKTLTPQPTIKPLALTRGCQWPQPLHNRYGTRYCTNQRPRSKIGLSGILLVYIYITTPVVSTLKTRISRSPLAFPAGILNHFWIQVAASHLKTAVRYHKPGGRYHFRSESSEML
jgi:hypothetical protein